MAPVMNPKAGPMEVAARRRPGKKKKEKKTPYQLITNTLHMHMPQVGVGTQHRHGNTPCNSLCK